MDPGAGEGDHPDDEEDLQPFRVLVGDLVQAGHSPQDIFDGQGYDSRGWKLPYRGWSVGQLGFWGETSARAVIRGVVGEIEALTLGISRAISEDKDKSIHRTLLALRKEGWPKKPSVFSQV